jgi:hypothetical protein
LKTKIKVPEKAQWLEDLVKKEILLPYVYMRSENHIKKPGYRHHSPWFHSSDVLYPEALSLESLSFGESILNLENKAFGLDLAMPRWVFYDCAIVPGFVCGYAMRREHLPPSYQEALGLKPQLKKSFHDSEWVPLSLFIMIPTIHKGEWVAHNLCAINSLVPDQDRLYGLGFLTKAFGLWYANVETCLGMTQWGKPALKLHSHFGYLEVITSYTPIHTYAKTMTYRCQVSSAVWDLFFSKKPDENFNDQFQSSGLVLDPQSEQSMEDLQRRIQKGEGPFYLSPFEIGTQDLKTPQTLFVPKS